METPKLKDLLKQAKYEFEHGAFSTLKQAEFFKAVIDLEPAPAPTKQPVKVAAKSTKE